MERGEGRQADRRVENVDGGVTMSDVTGSSTDSVRPMDTQPETVTLRLSQWLDQIGANTKEMGPMGG